MMAAAVAGQRGLKVVLIDHARKLAEKIRISGGGRCNFTNIGATPAQFVSRNPHFCRSALAGYGPRDFLDLVERHGIRWHEKHRGQLFCDESSEQIIDMLRAECEDAGVVWRMPCSVESVEQAEHGFRLQTSSGGIEARQLVLATGGMAIPQLGATDFALRIARQFGLKVVEPRPALVPLVFDAAQWAKFAELSGVALEVVVRNAPGSSHSPSQASGRTAQPSSPKRPGGGGKGVRQGGKGGTPVVPFLEDLLFTHRGLSGPAILQISTFWNPGEVIEIDLAPDTDLAEALLAAKQGSRQQLTTALSGLWPRRLAEQWLAQAGGGLAQARLADVPDRQLQALADGIHRWQLTPTGTAGYRKAEAMRGGVDTDELDQRSMQARKVDGLYFIGEAVDVTGWLGGYNFQWAWSSAVACGRALLV
ncbi:NAD(P)/FAD-dependent oxidoreductase [Achromobacter sp. F4_2707]|uniref:NAD(P)/FAD-dependent oxidoreductase n=1 Tax=Achromobacter sp. F4_2707 TaxID=3114286 RepID=UPI0039C5F034